MRASFLVALVDRIAAHGRSAQPPLNRIWISPAQLSDPIGAIPLPLIVGFLETAADPFRSARLGDGLAAADMGPVGIVLPLSASIERGISRIARYAEVLQGGRSSEWVEDRDQNFFSDRISDPMILPRRQDAKFSLTP